MKIYVIVPINYEYNDEYYEEHGFEEPVAAFRSRSKATERLYDLTQKQAEYGIDTDDGPAIAFHKLVELDVPDSDVEAP